jgi:Mrp family chromosome partitioning ATPase
MDLPIGDAPASAALPVFPEPERTRLHEVSEAALSAQNVFGFRRADPRARAFKLLRSQMAKRSEGDRISVIGVTSAAPGVGKSFVASNLAAALSRIALSDVYLIDLDLHRPALADRFGLTKGPDAAGVHDYLAGDVPDLASVARRINDNKLVVVPGFRNDVATGEMLTGAQGDRLFDAMRAFPGGTTVVVDMPPIFAADDAVIIGRRVDGVLLVIEDGRTTAKQARDTIRVLQPTPLIGTVLNRYRNQLLADDYGYGYSYGYGSYY